VSIYIVYLSFFAIPPVYEAEVLSKRLIAFR